MILVTRPEPEATQLAEILQRLGVETQVHPLLVINWLTPSLGRLERFQAILVTSRNSLKAFAKIQDLANLPPLLVVGEATAQLACELGAVNVISAEGDSKALQKLVRASCSPQGGDILYLRGEVTHTNLAQELNRCGYKVEEAILYQSQAVTRLSSVAIKSIKLQRITAVAFFSPRTGQIFAKIITSCGLENHLKQMKALCLSPQVADSVRCMAWAEVLTACQPNMKDFIALCKEA